MSDISTITIPVAALGPVLAAVNAWLEGRKRKSLGEQLAAQAARIAELERQVHECQESRIADWERWAREVRRGAMLAARPASSQVPPPEWDEPTQVRLMRAELEAQGLREELQRYVEEMQTPPRLPRPKLPSRPR